MTTSSPSYDTRSRNIDNFKHVLQILVYKVRGFVLNWGSQYPQLSNIQMRANDDLILIKMNLFINCIFGSFVTSSEYWLLCSNYCRGLIYCIFYLLRSIFSRLKFPILPVFVVMQLENYLFRKKSWVIMYTRRSFMSLTGLVFRKYSIILVIVQLNFCG